MANLCAAFSSVSDGACQGCTDPSCRSEELWELGGLEEDEPQDLVESDSEEEDQEQRLPAVWNADPRFMWEWTPEKYREMRKVVEQRLRKQYQLQEMAEGVEEISRIDEAIA
eukprot:4444079-Karenia_brevis.AAC.1